MALFKAVLQRLHSTPIVNKGSKSEAGILGEFKVYNVAGDELLSLYSMENFGIPTDEANLDKPIIPRLYNLQWANSSVCVPPLYRKAHKLGLNKAIWLHDPNNPKFAHRRIMIHIGNDAIDTLGCILLGTGYNAQSGKITNSTKAVEQFYNFCDLHGINNIVLEVRGLKLDVEV
ncbi:DUF5675 family protein [Helicobacter suis]|uniref:DUF5675 family protein n=1 Tax=Helicobacter suis TaxID=104628 RepID=UPI0013D5AF16|nr:DUF5675 family protein [Helicobacter suis]